MSQKISLSQPTPKALLDAFSTTLPNGFWKGWDEFRFNRMSSHPWPKSIFSPRSVIVEYLRRWLPDEALSGAAAKVQAFGAWRAGQSIYRFDTDVYQSIVDMAIPDTLPVNLFSKMPEWCLYIETPGMTLGDDVVYGFFATIEHDQQDSILLMIHTEKSKIEAVKINLETGQDIHACIKNSVFFGYFFKVLENVEVTDIVERQAALLSPFLNLLLFVCTQASEIGDEKAKPCFPQAQKTRKGPRLFPPVKPNVWDVAVRMGAALRLAREQASQSVADGPGGSVRPHIRRAHWHGYWHGPRDGERSFEVKWMPPIAVMVNTPDELPAVIRAVN